MRRDKSARPGRCGRTTYLGDEPPLACRAAAPSSGLAGCLSPPRSPRLFSQRRQQQLRVWPAESELPTPLGVGGMRTSRQIALSRRDPGRASQQRPFAITHRPDAATSALLARCCVDVCCRCMVLSVSRSRKHIPINTPRPARSDTEEAVAGTEAHDFPYSVSTASSPRLLHTTASDRHDDSGAAPSPLHPVRRTDDKL